MSGLATDLLRGVGAALTDLERAVRDVAGWRDLLSELGWDPVPLPPAIAAIATPAGEVVAAIAALERGVTPAAIDRARTAVVAVIDAIDGLSSLDLGATGLGADLAAATFDHLVIAWLAREHPLLYAGLIVAGLIEVHYLHEPAAARVPPPPAALGQPRARARSACRRMDRGVRLGRRRIRRRELDRGDRRSDRRHRHRYRGRDPPCRGRRPADGRRRRTG